MFLELIMHNKSLKKIIYKLCSNSIFKPINEVFCHSPYVRPIYNTNNISSYKKESLFTSYMAHKLLRVIYEIDTLYLPTNQNFEQFNQDYIKFYGDELKITASISKPLLENLAFSHIYSKIECKVPNSKNLIDFFKSEYDRFQNIGLNSICNTMLSSKNPQRAAKIFLVNFSIDTLSEGSAMLKVLGGNYGKLQNNMFKILYDELGKGIYHKRHNILFEKLLISIGMNSGVHYYWNFHLPSTLQLHNYFQYLVSNKILFFRYIGCLFAAEASFSNTSMHISKTLHSIFGDSTNREYFEEHYNVDKWHGKVALNLVILAHKIYGETIVPEILLGYFGFFELGKCNNIYFENYIKWLDSIEIFHTEKLHNILGTVISTKHFKNSEFKVEISETRLLLYVSTGSIEFKLGIEDSIIIKAGEAILIDDGIVYQYITFPDTIVSLHKHKHSE
jgi:hypothetical protein